MEAIKINKSENSSSLDQKAKVLIDLLLSYKKQKNNRQYINKVLIAITNWQLEIHNIDFVTINLKNELRASASTIRESKTINLNSNLIVKATNLKCFSILIFDFLHELAHLSQKDMKPFYFKAVVFTLNNICKYPFEDAYSIALGMYNVNKTEIQADSIASEQMKSLKSLENKKSSIIQKMIKIQNKENKKIDLNYSENKEMYFIFKNDIQKKLTRYLNKKSTKNESIVNQTAKYILDTYD